MFEKLFMLVKNNAGTAVINNPVIAAKDRDAVMIEASSSIIEVLKNQMESGKLNDLISFFKYSGIYSATLISSMVNRFANKLNNFYDVEFEAAHTISAMLITDVLKQLVAQSKSGEVADFAPGYLLTSLNGNGKDLSPLVNSMMAA